MPLSPARRRLSLTGALTLACAALAWPAAPARAAALDDLRAFAQQAQSGRAGFQQTVTAPDGRRKLSTGRFEFQRPNRFRFEYLKPYPQSLVGDGAKVWVYDPDLNQVSVRPLGEALGNTPAALLVSAKIDVAFTLTAQPDAEGLQWVLAVPRQAEGTVRRLRVGFKDHQLAALEIADSFGQVSRLVFDHLELNVAFPAEHFRFDVPAGADVAAQ